MEDGSHGRRRRGDPAALFQVFQGVHCQIDDAVPALVKLESFLRQENGGVRPDVEDCYWYNFEDGSYERLVLALHDRGLEKTPFFSRTLSSVIADTSLRRAGFVPFLAETDKPASPEQPDLQKGSP